jgi:hypothetical protein
MMPSQANERESRPGPVLELGFLNAREIEMIEQAIERVLPSGEVHLTVQRGRLRFVACRRELEVGHDTG